MSATSNSDVDNRHAAWFKKTISSIKEVGTSLKQQTHERNSSITSVDKYWCGIWWRHLFILIVYLLHYNIIRGQVTKHSFKNIGATKRLTEIFGAVFVVKAAVQNVYQWILRCVIVLPGIFPFESVDGFQLYLL